MLPQIGERKARGWQCRRKTPKRLLSEASPFFTSYRQSLLLSSRSLRFQFPSPIRLHQENRANELKEVLSYAFRPRISADLRRWNSYRCRQYHHLRWLESITADPPNRSSLPCSNVSTAVSRSRFAKRQRAPESIGKMHFPTRGSRSGTGSKTKSHGKCGLTKKPERNRLQIQEPLA